MEIVRRRVIEGQEVRTIEFIPEVRDHGYAKIFKMMSQQVLTDLKGEINGATDVLWFFIDRVISSESFHENPVIYARSEVIAAAVGRSVPTVKRHLRILTRLHYVFRIRRCEYQVNPEFLFVGRATPRLKAQLEFGRWKGNEGE